MIHILFALALESTTSAKSLDFWIGNWTCVGRSLNADGKTWSETRATNRIERVLGGKVIHENFEMGAYHGESWSVFSPKAGKWQQTWVDDQGGYIALTGGMEGDRFQLTTLPRPKQPKTVNRMVYRDVKPESFTWRWEASKDGGKTWQLQWELNYKRREP